MTRLTPILITLFCFIVTPVFTRHIVGGDIKYTCVSSNSDQQTTTFAVSFTMYRDVLGGGANYDLNAQFDFTNSHFGVAFTVDVDSIGKMGYDFLYQSEEVS